MLTWLKDKYLRLKNKFGPILSYASCYDKMEDQGVAVFGMCAGHTRGKLCITCLGCPHYQPTTPSGGQAA